MMIRPIQPARRLAAAAALAALCACSTAPAPTAQSASAGPTAARSDSEPAKIGAPAPDFTLTDLSGREHSVAAYTQQGKIVVLEWFNPDCPVTRFYHDKPNRSPANLMATTANDYAERGVVWLAVNSGAPGKQGAGFQRNQQAVHEYGIPFPVLLDESGKVGKLYGAKTTPHMFVIDTKGVLRYAGGIEDAGKHDVAGAKNMVVAALDELLAGEAVSVPHTKQYGCSVKYAD